MTVQYGKIVGRFLASIADGIDFDDDPDLVPLRGTITFTPKVNKVLVQDSLDPVSIYPMTIQANLDSEGYLVHNFKRGVKLLAPTEHVNPSGWTWQVSFDLSQGNTKIATQSFPIGVPEYNPADPSTAVDLALASPVPDASGVPITRGEPGASVEDIEVNESGTALIFTIGGSNPTEKEIPLPDVANRVGSKIFLDTDGTPYFDPLSESAGIAIATDTDGIPYIIGEI